MSAHEQDLNEMIAVLNARLESRHIEATEQSGQIGDLKRALVEAEADRDRVRDIAVVAEQQLAEIKRLAYIGGQSADFVRRQILGVFETERRALGNSRTACAHCGQTILRRSSDGMWFSKAEIGPVTSDCNEAPDGLHAPAGGEAL